MTANPYQPPSEANAVPTSHSVFTSVRLQDVAATEVEMQQILRLVSPKQRQKKVVVIFLVSAFVTFLLCVAATSFNFDRTASIRILLGAAMMFLAGVVMP